MTPTLEAVARMSASGVVGSLVEGTAAAVLAWATLKVVGKWHSTVRFAVWFSALLMIALACIAGWAGRSTHSGVPSAALVLPSSWALDIFYLWIAGAGLALFRVGLGFWQIVRLRRGCERISIEVLPPEVRTTLQSWESKAEVCLSHDVRVPTAVGFFKPQVLLPDWCVRELSGEELNAVLIHEFEHLRRHDDWSNLAQKLLGAVLFFHPAVWWIERKLALEREMACDDAVLAKTENPHAYAACLITVAEKSLVRRGVALAQAAVSRVRQTTIRVTQILSGDRAVPAWSWKPAVYWVSGITLSGALLISQAPPLVAFQSELPAMAVSSSSGGVTLASGGHAAGLPAPHVILAGAKRTVSAPVKTTTPKAGAVQAKLPVTRSVPPARLQMASAEATPPQTVFVVMHTEQYDRFGGMMLTICVWQVDVPGSNLAGPGKTIPAKSI